MKHLITVFIFPLIIISGFSQTDNISARILTDSEIEKVFTEGLKY